jgi:hypothetical protein
MQILYFYEIIKTIKNIIIVLLNIYLISINTWLQPDRHAMNSREI